MRLTEFYSLSEGHDTLYTLEQDGRLLEWDQAVYNDVGEIIYEEMSCQQIAMGGLDRLVGELSKRVQLNEQTIQDIEKVWLMNEGTKFSIAVNSDGFIERI